MISGKIAAEILATVCRGSDYTAEALHVYAKKIWNSFGAVSQYTYKLRQQFSSVSLSASSKTIIKIINQINYQGSVKVKQRINS